MQYEQDYIMRLIKQVIRALIGVLMNKKSASYYIFPVNGQQKSGDDFLQRLTPYCCCGSPLLRGQYILGSVMPTIILGFIQGWIAIRTGSFLLFCLSLSSPLQGDHLFTQKCDAGTSGIPDPINHALITLLWMPIQQPSEISNNTLMSFFIVDSSFLSSNAITVSP